MAKIGLTKQCIYNNMLIQNYETVISRLHPQWENEMIINTWKRNDVTAINRILKGKISTVSSIPLLKQDFQSQENVLEPLIHFIVHDPSCLRRWVSLSLADKSRKNSIYSE